jgi:hypothetical protein
MGRQRLKLRPDDKAVINRLKDTETAEEIAAKLGVAPDVVRGFITPQADLGRRDVTTGARWAELRRHFTRDEQAYFQEEYDRWVGQSDDALLPSEETQLIQALTLGVLINRSLTKQRSIEEDLDRVSSYKRKLEKLLADEHRHPDEKETVLLHLFRDDVKGLKADLVSEAGKYTEFSKERNSILKGLKMTRDQRVKELESGKETFVSLMKSFQKKEVRDREGRRMELLRLAAQKEYERLGKFREFPDGSEDQPLLNAETVALHEDLPPQNGGGDDHDDRASGEVNREGDGGEAGPDGPVAAAEGAAGVGDGDGGPEGVPDGERPGPGRPHDGD